MTTRQPTTPGLMERLDAGLVICAEGYLFELERRGYLQAGPYVPEVVLEHPDLVRQLHREFVHAGSDVVEAFTYYAHREKLTVIGREQGVERLNRDALAIASEVADESGALLAGNVCNTNIWNPDSARSRKAARAMFEEQVGWAVDADADFVIGETFEWVGEAMAALETIKAAGKRAVITFSIVPHGTLFDADAVEGCRRLTDAGADVVGFNCSYGPATMLPLVEAVRENVSCHVAALPVPYRTTDEHPSFSPSGIRIATICPMAIRFPPRSIPTPATELRVLRRHEILAAATDAGYQEVRWHSPESTGYYQPIVTGRNRW